jgi:hypothetical protein
VAASTLVFGGAFEDFEPFDVSTCLARFYVVFNPFGFAARLDLVGFGVDSPANFPPSACPGDSLLSVDVWVALLFGDFDIFREFDVLETSLDFDLLPVVGFVAVGLSFADFCSSASRDSLSATRVCFDSEIGVSERIL